MNYAQDLLQNRFSIKIGLKKVLVLKGRLGHVEKSDIHSSLTVDK